MLQYVYVYTRTCEHVGRPRAGRAGQFGGALEDRQVRRLCRRRVKQLLEYPNVVVEGPGVPVVDVRPMSGGHGRGEVPELHAVDRMLQLLPKCHRHVCNVFPIIRSPKWCAAVGWANSCLDSCWLSPLCDLV